MSLIYGTSTILFILKIFPFQHSLLLWSSSHKSRYGNSAGNVCENVSAYGLGLTVFVLSENYEVRFYSFYFYIFIYKYLHKVNVKTNNH